MGSSIYTEDRYHVSKRRFSHSERYAIWSHHERRCWFCLEPLRLHEVTVDHVLPEALLANSIQRDHVLAEYGLKGDFQINGFENWLPCHARCNAAKAAAILEFVPKMKVLLDKLIRAAPQVERTVAEIRANAAKDDLLGRVMVGLEQRTLTVDDLRVLLADITGQTIADAPANMIRLDNGYWIRADDIAREGTCCCERPTCLEASTKVYCLFSNSHSACVISKGLYWRCYDEVVQCPRCDSPHKRGHIGRGGVCGRPYRDQFSQCD